VYDRRALPQADLEFVVVGDTHYMHDVDDVEFESRRKQTARVEAAIARINAIDPDFVVHLGDLVQAYPGSGGYESALEEALIQLERIEAETHFVAGNHDVGDKPDPTMPTDWVSADSLDRYHDRVGPSWTAWEAGDCHFVVLNSQIMNADLEAATAQRTWAEQRVADIDTGPAFLFCHLPPFLHSPDDPGLGHYDSIAEPARSWVCDLVRDTPITDVFCGHCHFEFSNRIGDVRVRVTPSVSFTRPGFAELFASGPPPERGRDEVAKLGFLLVRVVDGDVAVVPIRTGGDTAVDADGPDRLLGRPLQRESPSPLGLSLAYPLTDTTAVPETFPSAVRYPVANAYPTLSCLELGAGIIRLPASELGDDRIRDFVRLLREQGATIVGTVLGVPGGEWSAPKPLDEIEVRLPADWVDTGEGLDGVAEFVATEGAVNLSEVVPRRDVPEKQHGRLRNGFPVADLATLQARLDARALEVDRVTCRLRDAADPWAEIRAAPAPEGLAGIEALDWLVSTMNRSMAGAIDRIAKAVAAVATRPGARLYLEPLRAMDRTMDPAPGLLDRRCNPTAAFTATRCLQTLLFETRGGWTAMGTEDRDGVEVVTLARNGSVRCLALPGAQTGRVSLPSPPSTEWEAAVRLPDGTVRRLDRPEGRIPVKAPTVFLGRR